MSDIVERLRRTTEQMACTASVDMRLWDKHSNACLDAAAEILRLRAENEKLRAALKDCASDLEAEIRGRYTGGGGWDIHPSLVKKFERDMSTVRAARAALGEKDV